MSLEKLREKGFDIAFHGHAEAILEVDFPECLQELETVLAPVIFPIHEIVGSGGGETKGTQRLRRALTEMSWRKGKFVIKKIINGRERESRTHEIDHVRTLDEVGTLVLEIEWNNKDPFFDRDLENFKRLHAEGAISAGIMITRGASLQSAFLDLVEKFGVRENLQSVEDLARLDLAPSKRQKADYARRQRGNKTFVRSWAESFVADKFGAATTHWRKLEDRIQRGVGSPCPLLLIGLPVSIVTR